MIGTVESRARCLATASADAACLNLGSLANAVYPTPIGTIIASNLGDIHRNDININFIITHTINENNYISMLIYAIYYSQDGKGKQMTPRSEMPSALTQDSSTGPKDRK
mmetsp:Transcript_17930/g.12869  ORF Transcript_17930/g.12869 Transcript_17930/m.12869 type:complete len:109 (+) Transcript_17930:605-931(+)